MKRVTQPVGARGTMLSAVAVVVALTALLAFAPFASATSDPLSSGTTTLTLNKGFFKKLGKSGIKVLKVSPAAVKSRTVTLPVSGGSLDPVTGLGTIEQSGGIKFKAGKKSAPVNTLVLETSTGALNAKVAGKTMKLASVKGVSVVRNGFGANVSVASMKLTGKAAKQLNKKLGFSGKKKSSGKGTSKKRASTSKTTTKVVKPPFKGNQVLGGSTSETQPKTVAVLPGGKANLVTDKATVEKFEKKVLPSGEGLGVKIEPVAPTELEFPPFPPVLKFPISGGTIAPDATNGIVETSGGVKLVQKPEEEGVPIPGTTTLTLGNIGVSFSNPQVATAEVIIESTISPKLNLGNLKRTSIADLNLAGATIKSDPVAHTVTVENAVATLQEVTATTLNQVFGTPYDEAKIPHPTFAKGDGLGVFSFTAQTQ